MGNSITNILEIQEKYPDQKIVTNMKCHGDKSFLFRKFGVDCYKSKELVLLARKEGVKTGLKKEMAEGLGLPYYDFSYFITRGGYFGLKFPFPSFAITGTRFGNKAVSCFLGNFISDLLKQSVVEKENDEYELNRKKFSSLFDEHFSSLEQKYKIDKDLKPQLRKLLSFYDVDTKENTEWLFDKVKYLLQFLSTNEDFMKKIPSLYHKYKLSYMADDLTDEHNTYLFFNLDTDKIVKNMFRYPKLKSNSFKCLTRNNAGVLQELFFLSVFQLGKTDYPGVFGMSNLEKDEEVARYYLVDENFDKDKVLECGDLPHLYGTIKKSDSGAYKAMIDLFVGNHHYHPVTQERSLLLLPESIRPNLDEGRYVVLGIDSYVFSEYDEAVRILNHPDSYASKEDIDESCKKTLETLKVVGY